MTTGRYSRHRLVVQRQFAVLDLEKGFGVPPATLIRSTELPYSSRVCTNSMRGFRQREQHFGPQDKLIETVTADRRIDDLSSEPPLQLGRPRLGVGDFCACAERIADHEDGALLQGTIFVLGIRAPCSPVVKSGVSKD